MSHRWQILLEPGWPPETGIPWRLALEVDPRRLTVALGPRVRDVASLEVQSGAVARSFFEVAQVELEAAGAWLAGDEAGALLEQLAAGFHCDVLWTGDPVVQWTEAGWEAGHTLYLKVASLLGPPVGG